VRLGTLVTAGTFRLPGPLAITVAQVDAMSRGRIELGIGAGWFDDEHLAHGIPFPSTRERFERLEEQLEIITGMWTTLVGETFSFHGRHYDLTGSPALPKPVQKPHPPIIIGGYGTKRTPALAARYAQEFNLAFPPLDIYADYVQRVKQACADSGRDPASLRTTVALVVCCGRDEAEFGRRAEAIGRQPDELRKNGAAGLPSEVVETLRAFEAKGAETAYLQVLDLADLAHLELLATEVMPSVGARAGAA
jgi:alkanesulfonate monooxygenase SsuD/methylene tetrahydromethanopterin reductase-like flavin-dependent oxidoreductase (luciferase family)